MKYIAFSSLLVLCVSMVLRAFASGDEREALGYIAAASGFILIVTVVGSLVKVEHRDIVN